MLKKSKYNIDVGATCGRPLLQRYTYTNKFQTKVVDIHTTIPQTVGIIKETIVHFQLDVSFFIVRSVVLHGKCSNENIITLIAVSRVHPF